MKHVPQERFDEIVNEVFDLLSIQDVFHLIERGAKAPDTRMEERLQELLRSCQSYECQELACYLRSCFSRKDDLPTWQPLLNAAIEMAHQRGEPAWDMFIGMVPNQAHPQRNTGQKPAETGHPWNLAQKRK